MAQQQFYSKLWHLSRGFYRHIYHLKIFNKPIIEGRKDIIILRGGLSSGKPIKLYEAHSQRAGWIPNHFYFNNLWYPGFEYKGIGLKGGGITERSDFPGWPWGGLWLENAVAEYNFAQKFNKLGLICEIPVSVYEAGELNGKKLGVIVRTMTSPLRISDLYLHPHLFKKYIQLRNQTKEQYFDWLAKRLAHNMRIILENNIFYHSVALNNITTEGELVDFEPLSDKEAAMSIEDKFTKMMSGMMLVGELCKGYSNIFLQTFFKHLLFKKIGIKYQLDQFIALERIVRLYLLQKEHHVFKK